MLKGVGWITAILASLLVGISIGTCVVIEYERSVFKAYEWEDPPMIANCYGGDFNELYIQEAISFWEKNGHSVAFIEQNPPDILCDSESMDGWIILKMKQQDGETLAVTKRRVIFGKIKSSTIYFNPGSYRLENVIAHELGHAFGYRHVKIDGHVMNPEWGKMGSKFWIP